MYKIIYHPQREHNELPESIRAYDGLDRGAYHFLCLRLNHFLIHLCPNHHPPWKVSWQMGPFLQKRCWGRPNLMDTPHHSAIPRGHTTVHLTH